MKDKIQWAVTERPNLLMQKTPMQRMPAAMKSAMKRTAANASSVYNTFTVHTPLILFNAIPHSTVYPIRHIEEHEDM